jgi:hypothetical protein
MLIMGKSSEATCGTDCGGVFNGGLLLRAAEDAEARARCVASPRCELQARCDREFKIKLHEVLARTYKAGSLEERRPSRHAD